MRTCGPLPTPLCRAGRFACDSQSHLCWSGQIKRQPGSPHHDGSDRIVSHQEELNLQVAAHHSKVAAASESTAYNISRQQKQAFLQGSADAHVSSLCWKKVEPACGLLATVSLLGR